MPCLKFGTIASMAHCDAVARALQRIFSMENAQAVRWLYRIFPAALRRWDL
jgi:hypothetical protein